jgi:DNA-binding CsgD family transcriptional regulator
MRQAAKIAHVRQLCCLGLDGQTMMPALLHALHGLVPSDSNGFFWVNEHFEMSNMWAERMLPPPLMKLYFSRFYNTPERSFRDTFAATAQSQYGVRVSRFPQEFYQTDYYNLILKELNAHTTLHGVVRNRGKALGQISIYRAPKDPPFTTHDEQALASLMHYIAHGLCAPSNPPESGSARPFRNSELTGLVILNARGEIIETCPHGGRLIFFAMHPQISASVVLSADNESTPAVLRRLCAQVTDVMRGLAVPPPVAQVQNAWGRFLFRAYQMQSKPGEDVRIGVTVQHQQPVELKLLSAMQVTRLSPQQKEVAMLLASDLSHQQIAEKLNVSLNTANYHIRQVYDKLDVHDRNEMLYKLLAQHDESPVVLRGH